MTRLELAPLTDEDVAIWRQITRDRRDAHPAFCCALVNPDSDRRDADLMYQAQRERVWGQIGWVPAMAPANIEPYPYFGGVRLHCRGQWLLEIDSDPASFA